MSLAFGETENELAASFTVDGAPQGKARPRVTMHGTYTPAKTKQYESAVQFAYMMQCHGAMFPDDANIAMCIYAYFPIPKSASKKKREDMQSGKIRPLIKSDWDNIGKAICDALNGLAYKDDSHIVTGIVHKYYDENPRVEVRIWCVHDE